MKQRIFLNMLEHQIIAGGITSPQVLEAFKNVNRIMYVPLAYRPFAYVDMAIPLSDKTHMLTPWCEAKILDALSLDSSHHVLEIGTGSGHMTALISQCARYVTTVEINSKLAFKACETLANNGIRQVRVLKQDGFSYFMQDNPELFDRIVFTGAISVIPERVLDYLTIGGEAIVFQKKGELSQAIKIKKLDAQEVSIDKLFETQIESLTEPPIRRPFVF